jgi:hypothetical protein
MACLKNAARTILIALFADIVIAIAKLIGGRSQFRFWPPAQFMRMASFPFPAAHPGNWAAIDGGSPDADAANQSRTSSQNKNALSVNAML